MRNGIHPPVRILRCLSLDARVNDTISHGCFVLGREGAWQRDAGSFNEREITNGLRLSGDVPRQESVDRVARWKEELADFSRR